MIYMRQYDMIIEILINFLALNFSITDVHRRLLFEKVQHRYAVMVAADQS